MASNLNLSNTSYTNKDFNEIYPELLEKAKELSYKWDPTVSNESDPGVTLIKEIALALDKINYAADKNALETMPLSVTQDRTARQLFQLLGYYPKWYISAESEVSIAWKTDTESEDYVDGGVVKIPAFTEIRDDSGDYVYTIPIDTPLHSDGSVEKVTAIQGVVKQLKINNSTLITLDLLDANNRVYFPDYNVAQNGVFVLSKDAQESKEINSRSFWQQKDNLYIEEVGNYFYSFNVDISTNRCYIEFPADISELIGGGIYVYYLISAGQDGLVGIGQLNQLYDSSVNAQYIQGGTGEITLNSSDLRIQNVDLLVTGKNPESINSMYQNYNHIKGTFDTIVTLRDYNNAVYNTEEVSNAVVCDRTNDVQQAYRIVASTLNDSENIVYTQEADREANPYQNGKIDPFGLKIYALQYNDLTNTTSTSQNKQAYDNTFQMYVDLDVEDPLNVDSSLRQLVELLNDERCIQHDFSDIEPNKICLIKNVAEASMMVFPTVKLTTLQKEDVVNSIRDQIYNLYNARKMNFGEEINYDDLYTNILTSSNLIKNISLNQIQYYAYALYYSDDEYDGTHKLAPAWKEVCVSDEVNYLLINRIDPTKDYTLSGDRLAHVATLYGTESNVKSKNKKNIFLMVADEDGYGNVYFLNRDNHVVLYSTKRNEFRNEILVKNILAGVTPLFEVGQQSFIYGANETDTQIDAAQNFDIKTTMPFQFSDPSTSPATLTTSARYYPKQNEVVQFVRPQLSSAISYSAYVKYDYVGQEIRANSDHKLTGDESLILYYKTEDSDSSPYTRVIYGSYKNQQFKPAIISPTFDLKQTTRAIQILQDPTQVPSTTVTIKSGQSIEIKQRNEVVLNSTTNYVYVMGDQFVDLDGVQQYKLRLNKESVDSGNFDGYYYYTTTLQNEQQFIYASDQLSYLNIVGSGTKVTLKTTNGENDYIEITNKVVSTRSIQRYGVTALDGKWQKISDEITLLAQEFINVIGTADTTVDEDSDAWVEIDSLIPIGSTIMLDRDGLYYQNSAEMESGVSSGNVSYLDNYGNDRTQEVTLNENVVSDFVTNSTYYNDQRESFVDRIELAPADYLEEEISGIYERGPNGQVNGPLSIVGTKSYEWNWVGGGKAHYLTSGASLYLVVINGASTKVAKINGFPSTLNSSSQKTITNNGIVDGAYSYSSSQQIQPGKVLIVIKPNAQINDQFYKIVQQNNGTQPVSISFSDEQNLNFSNGTCVAYEVTYYTITNIIMDYNTDEAGFYVTPIGVTSITSNVTSSGNPKQYITAIGKDIMSDQEIQFALTQAQDAYQYADTSAALQLRYWEYQNSQDQRSIITDAHVRSYVLDYYDQSFIDSLTDRTINKWQWPLANFSISMVAVRDIGELSPGVFSFKYKNKGGEEESIQISSERDSGWSVYGLAYIDSSATKPTKIYDDQVVFINGEEITTPSNKVSYVYSSVPIYAEGYRPVGLKYVNDQGDEDYPQMLVTTLPKSFSNYKEDVWTKTITIEKEVGTHTDDGWSDTLKLTFDVPKEQFYIMKIKNYFDLERFWLLVKPTNFDVMCLNAPAYPSSASGQRYELADKGTYYFCLYPKVVGHTDTAPSVTFNVGIIKKTLTYDTTGLTDAQYDLLESQGTVKVEISQIQSLDYSEDSAISTGTVWTYVPLVQQRAQYNGVDIFNYFYQPQDDKKILNPLRGESFNNHNHFYNPFTICKVETYDLVGDSNIFINM